MCTGTHTLTHTNCTARVPVAGLPVAGLPVAGQVSTLRIAECEDPATAVDYLIEFCQSCTEAAAKAEGRGGMAGYSADCEAMRGFSLRCIARCQSDASKPPQMVRLQNLTFNPPPHYWLGQRNDKAVSWLSL